jgi:hypothetical protein
MIIAIWIVVLGVCLLPAAYIFTYPAVKHCHHEFVQQKCVLDSKTCIVGAISTKVLNPFTYYLVCFTRNEY